MKVLKTADKSSTGVATNQVLVAASAVDSDQQIVVWAASGSFETGIVLEDSTGVKLIPTLVAALDSKNIPCGYDGLPCFVVTAGRGLQYDASGDAGVRVEYSLERSPFMTAIGKKAMLTADLEATTNQTDTEIIAAPPAGKKIVVWKAHGTFKGDLELKSNGNAAYPILRGNLDTKALSLPYRGLAYFAGESGQSLTYDLTAGATPSVGIRLCYTIEDAGF